MWKIIVILKGEVLKHWTFNAFSGVFKKKKKLYHVRLPEWNTSPPQWIEFHEI